MKKYRKIRIFLMMCIVFSPLFLYAADSAATTYKILEPIPGFSDTPSSVGAEIGQYIRAGYLYMLGIAVALSVLMLVVGGVEYTMTFVSESKKGEAKNRIENAITGLLIALLSFVVLNTISPNLVQMEVPNATSCTPAGSGTPAPAAPTVTPGQAPGSGSGQ